MNEIVLVILAGVLFILIFLTLIVLIIFSKPSNSSRKLLGKIPVSDFKLPNNSKYRILVSAQCKSYQDWQVLSLFHSAKKYWPDVSVIRLMSCAPSLRSKYKYTEICPTITLSEWERYSNDEYLPYNRPGTLVEFISTYNSLDEIFILMDPDMIILKPLNLPVLEGRPIAQRYEYMEGNLLTKLSKLTKNPHLVQPVGQPMLIHGRDLRRLAPLYLDFTYKIRSHPVYKKEVGWIAEMYGYALAAAELGLIHDVREDLMCRPPYRKDSFTLHYDYMHEDHSCGEFKWDKRSYWQDIFTSSELFPIPCASTPINFRRVFEELNESLIKYRIEKSVNIPRLTDCIFIINCLNPPSTPLIYSNIRSIYSIEERWTQLINSIESVRKYHPTAVIYIAETGDIPDEYRRRQEQISGVIWLNYGRDLTIAKNRDSPHKGLTELLVLHRTYDDWRRYRRLFKLSGRYQITKSPPMEFNKFLFAPWSDDKRDGNRSAYTVYYGVPHLKFTKFKEILDRYLIEYQNESIETSIAQYIPDSDIIWYRNNSLGFKGNIAVNGKEVTG